MASIREALGADLSQYHTVSAQPGMERVPGIADDFQPSRGSVTRCPLPPVWQVSPDSLRQFYLKGTVPQSRLMTPAEVPVASNAAIVNSAAATGQVARTIFVNGPVTTPAPGPNTTSTAANTGKVQQVAITTGVLGPGSKNASYLNMSIAFQLLRLSAGSPCRIQMYGTALAQASDLVRGLDVAPPAGTTQDLICDVVLDTAPYSWSFQSRMGANAESPQTGIIYITITNLDSTSDSIDVTATYAGLVAAPDGYFTPLQLTQNGPTAYIPISKRIVSF